MKIDLSNPPYAVKLKELGFAYSYTDREKGVIVYTHAEPRLVGSPWINSTFEQAEHRWDELDREGFDVLPIIECVVDANCWEYIGGYAE